jgi:hypothetical protein
MPDYRPNLKDKGEIHAEFRFSSQTSRVLTNIDGANHGGLSVSPDRKDILFSKSVKFGVNLMMIENFR